MSKNCLITLLAVATLSGQVSFAAPPPAILPPSSLIEGNLESFSIGVNYEAGMRKMVDKSGGGSTLVRIQSVAGYVGVDLLDWWTLFGTIGVSQAKPDGSSVSGDPRLKWSAGTSFNIFHTDIEDPFPFNGRWSLKATAEYAQYQTRLGRDVKWSDISVALPVSYELAGVRTWPFCNLVIYGGPALSYINGTDSFTGESEFKEDQSFGAVGGVDITFFDNNIAVGGFVQYFGNTTGGCCARWHF